MSSDGRGIHGLVGEKAPEAESQGERDEVRGKKRGRKKKATKEEGAGRKRKAEREERAERSGRGEGATEPNAASQCVSETDCKNRNCKMCNCRVLLGWTNAGIAGDVSGRSIPGRPRLPPLFSPVDLVQLERELRRDRSSSVPTEGVLLKVGIRWEASKRIYQLWRLDSEIFLPRSFDLRSDCGAILGNR